VYSKTKQEKKSQYFIIGGLIRAQGGHIQITIMIDKQQQYIKLNIRGEISIIVVQAHSGKKRDLMHINLTH
jgi:hypothetical protein